ncbi:MAG: hypothetical protein OEW87_08665, partial [Flavobacteriaceae bacterium]|nr:hypothetical protein [Flavobacteriaceae bacterium]
STYCFFIDAIIHPADEFQIKKLPLFNRMNFSEKDRRYSLAPFSTRIFRHARKSVTQLSARRFG